MATDVKKVSDTEVEVNIPTKFNMAQVNAKLSQLTAMETRYNALLTTVAADIKTFTDVKASMIASGLKDTTPAAMAKK